MKKLCAVLLLALAAPLAWTHRPSRPSRCASSSRTRRAAATTTSRDSSRRSSPNGSGQPFVVENRPGAGTLIGTEAAAKSPADGYTLLLSSIVTHALAPTLYPRSPYDPLRDFVPVTTARGRADGARASTRRSPRSRCRS